MSLEGRTELLMFANSTLIAVRYQYEILRAIVTSYAGAVFMGSSWCMIIPGLMWHLLNDEGIKAINWPSCSSDLNPIENLWEVMYQSIQSRQIAPQTVQELTDTLIQVWEEIPQDTIGHLIKSMPRCCQECIQAQY